jgi:thiol-disulfide isomerase/thioredoxin
LKRIKPLLILIILLVVGILIFIGSSKSLNKVEVRAAVGFTAPDFTLKDQKGNNVKLSSFRGKAVFINFWATWCGFCKMEMPSIEKVYEKRKDEIIILAINWTSTEKEPGKQSADIVKDFIRLTGYTFPVLLDVDGKIAEDYLVRGIPVNFFIDKNGIITAKHIGAMTEDMINDYIDDAIKGYQGGSGD